jgi:hypothetical protein
VQWFIEIDTGALRKNPFLAATPDQTIQYLPPLAPCRSEAGSNSASRILGTLTLLSYLAGCAGKRLVVLLSGHAKGL